MSYSTTFNTALDDLATTTATPWADYAAAESNAEHTIVTLPLAVVTKTNRLNLAAAENAKDLAQGAAGRTQWLAELSAESNHAVMQAAQTLGTQSTATGNRDLVTPPTNLTLPIPDTGTVTLVANSYLIMHPGAISQYWVDSYFGAHWYQFPGYLPMFTWAWQGETYGYYWDDRGTPFQGSTDYEDYGGIGYSGFAADYVQPPNPYWGIAWTTDFGYAYGYWNYTPNLYTWHGWNPAYAGAISGASGNTTIEPKQELTQQDQAVDTSLARTFESKFEVTHTKLLSVAILNSANGVVQLAAVGGFAAFATGIPVNAETEQSAELGGTDPDRLNRALIVEQFGWHTDVVLTAHRVIKPTTDQSGASGGRPNSYSAQVDNRPILFHPVAGSHQTHFTPAPPQATPGQPPPPQTNPAQDVAHSRREAERAAAVEQMVESLAKTLLATPWGRWVETQISKQRFVGFRDGRPSEPESKEIVTLWFGTAAMSLSQKRRQLIRERDSSIANLGRFAASYLRSDSYKRSATYKEIADVDRQLEELESLFISLSLRDVKIGANGSGEDDNPDWSDKGFWGVAAVARTLVQENPTGLVSVESPIEFAIGLVGPGLLSRIARSSVSTEVRVTAQQVATGAVGAAESQIMREVTTVAERSLLKEYAEKLAATLGRVESNRQRGAVLSVVRDRITGEIFDAQNLGSVATNLHPLLKSRLDKYLVDAGGTLVPRFGIPGSHSEIWALNAALMRREALGIGVKSLDEFSLYNVSLWRNRLGTVVPRCNNCRTLTKGVRVLSGQ